MGILTDDSETVAFEERARGDGDLGVEAEKVCLPSLLKDSFHDGRHAPLSRMDRGNVGAIDMAVGVKLNEACDFIADGGHPWIHAHASITPFVGPSLIAFNGRRPGLALFLGIVLASQFMHRIVVDLADLKFVAELISPNEVVWARLQSRGCLS